MFLVFVLSISSHVGLQEQIEQHPLSTDLSKVQ